MLEIVKSEEYHFVVYADGGAIPNPGFSGYGIHGFIYAKTKDAPKKATVIPNHFATTMNANPNAVDYSFATTKGYRPYSPQLAESDKAIWVTPVGYMDVCFSYFEAATNNIAELGACRAAMENCLAFIHAGYKVGSLLLVLDSQYVLQTLEKYGDAYRKNGWKTSQGTEAKNKELIEAMLVARDNLNEKGVKISTAWCKGHQGDLGNGMADYQASIGVRRSKAMDNPGTVRWSLHKNYWDADVVRHPLLTMKRSYHSRVNSVNEPGLYFQIEPGSEDLMIGKRDHEAYSLTRLHTPCLYQEALREAQSKFGQDENRVVLVRNERLYNKFIQKYIREHGHFCLGPSTNEKAVNFLDQAPVALDHNPPALFYRVLEALGQMEERLEEFIKKTGEGKDVSTNTEYSDMIVHDVTSEFYTVEDKKVGKDMVRKAVLNPVFVNGYTNHVLEVEETRDEETRKLKVPLALGMDLPNRNALKHLEDHLPNIYLLTWKASPDVLQYAFVIDCTTGVSIWSNYYCDRLFLKSK